MTTVYTVPTNPADPEAAALELIVHVPSDVLGYDNPPRDALQDFASLLHAEGSFAGMSWHDARHARPSSSVTRSTRTTRRKSCGREPRGYSTAPTT